MTFIEKLDAIIAELTAFREDAEKIDKGKTGAPGTRLRKATSSAQVGLRELRAQVIEARKSK